MTTPTDDLFEALASALERLTEAARRFEALVGQTIARFELLRGRMEARDEHDGRLGDRTSGYSHSLSRFEIDGWIDELRAAVAQPPVERPVGPSFAVSDTEPPVDPSWFDQPGPTDHPDRQGCIAVDTAGERCWLRVYARGMCQKHYEEEATS